MDEAAELNQHMHLLFTAFVFSAITLWIARGRGFFKFTPSIPNNAASLELWEVVAAFSIFIGVGLVFMPLVALAWASWSGKDVIHALQMPLQGWFNFATIAATAAGLASYVSWLSQSARNAIARNAFSGGMLKIFRDFLLGACAWLISYPLVVFIGQLISALVPSHHIDQVAVKYLKMTMEYPSLFIMTAFLLIFVVPIVEETLFRGFLQTWLRQYFGVFTSIFITSLIFASFHFSPSQGIANIELLASLLILSFFLGFLYERQQSLFASIGLHVTFNAISVIAILLSA